MPAVHRPDFIELTTKLLSAKGPGDLRGFLGYDSLAPPSDALLWPYMNLEDLTKPKSLLVFLNARGQNPPLVFAPTEEVFTLLGEMTDCGSEPELLQCLLRFSIDPEPMTYGSVSPICKALEEYEQDETGYDFCLRPSLLTLYLQQRLLRFLVKCSERVLHDMSENALLYGTLQDEPCSSELEVRSDLGHTTFSDALMLAPYGDRDTVDFARLRGYFNALYTGAKDHLWALREDPSYFADTFAEIIEHSVSLILDSNGNVHRSLDSIELLQIKAREIVIESYTMYAIWKDLHDLLQNLETSSQDKADKAFALLMSQLFCRIQKSGQLLQRMIAGYMRSAPSMSKFYLRVNTPLGMSITNSDKQVKDTAILHLLCSFRLFREDPNTALEDGALHNLLDHLATILRTSNAARDLMSPRLSEWITQMSVIGECIMQQSLWQDAPQGHGIKHTCDYSYNTEFYIWLYHLDRCDLPVHQINPFRGKLSYPIHKTRNRSNVTSMCNAEASLDRFWECVDTSYEKTTGVAQYDIIKQCLNDGPPMRRTTPWEDPDQKDHGKHETPEYIYLPFSRMFHDEAMQITGGFDRLSVGKKLKPKTKGNTAILLMVDDGAVEIEVVPPCRFILDKRAYKAMKTLFHVPSSDSENLNKVVKSDEFKRAMARMGFSVEKLQGSAWQFNPSGLDDVDRAIQFHEPHPDSDIPYIMARRFGRRLGRVYGWNSDTFRRA